MNWAASYNQPGGGESVGQGTPSGGAGRPTAAAKVGDASGTPNRVAAIVLVSAAALALLYKAKFRMVVGVG